MKLWTTLAALVFLGCFNSGCVVEYLVKSSYHQQKLLRARTPISEVLVDSEIDKETKRKLNLALEARKFGEEFLYLTPTDNYQSYVQLENPYVTWVARVSSYDQIEAYNWWFPIVGSISYKGYFSREEAEEEAKKFDSKKYDTYVRGVTAFSTLGWFEDPILSSMMSYSDHDLVELIIHESVHATLYIKSSTDFNERLATFLGGKGVEQFYLKKEGENSPTVELIRKENHDKKLFSDFISKEIKSLKKWYTSKRKNNENLDPNFAFAKRARIKNMQKRFAKTLREKFKTTNYIHFSKLELNNARLLSYSTYTEDLSDFEKLFKQVGGDFKKFLEECKKLEDEKKPADVLKQLVAKN